MFHGDFLPQPGRLMTHADPESVPRLKFRTDKKREVLVEHPACNQEL